MSLLDDLSRWKTAGSITEAQHDWIAAIVRKDRFSVYTELTAVLYLGVVACVAGVGWTIRTHFAQLGDMAILVALTAAFGASLAYCFVRGLPYARGRQESAEFAFDYVLYFGCLLFGVELGFIEYRFHLLEDNWDHYLLLSSVVYFTLAYRFDNRFVLSLALSSLAGWFGLRVAHLLWLPGSIRLYALGYASAVALVGATLERASIKEHFFETYLHVSANVALAALTAGVIDPRASSFYFAGLVLLAAVSIGLGVKFTRFAFVLYGVAYAYVGISALVQRHIRFSMTGSFAYDAVSATAVIIVLVLIARRFGREA
jgi:hypothetical protein